MPASAAGAAANWVRSIDLPVGVGMFGRAVAERAVVMTSDYMDDAAFPHAAETDRVVRDIGIRSMVVAPLVSGETVFGALGAFSSKTDAFEPVGDRARPRAGRPRRRLDEQRAPDRSARRIAT